MLRSAIVTAAVSFGLASAALAQDDEPPANSCAGSRAST